MASEAQRLIGISLTKIAQSRANRGGVSLHKNLLVATVLQKARYIFMEEAYNMVHYQSPTTTTAAVQSRTESQEDLVGLTAEEAGIDSMPLSEDVEEASNLEFLQPATPCVKCSENPNKENQPPYTTTTTMTTTSSNSGEVTYLDLDKTSSSARGSGGGVGGNSPCLKRRRAVTDWETEEAVQSILPKRLKSGGGGGGGAAAPTPGPAGNPDEEDDSVFLDDATILSDNVAKELEVSARNDAVASSSSTSGSAMEIDRITSLVSIFSFGMGEGKLNRSVSTPDLCSAQAKDNGDALQQRQFIAMTV